MSKTQKDFDSKVDSDLREMIDYYKSKRETLTSTPTSRFNKLSLSERKLMIDQRIWELEFRLNCRN